MRIKLQHWDKKHIIGFCLLLAIALFFLVASIPQMTTGDIKGGLKVLILLETLPAIVLYAIGSPRGRRCMRAVKGKMKYAELKKAVENEDFEEPIRLYDGGSDKYRRYMLFSDSWVVFGWDGIMKDPFCIPKNEINEVCLATGELYKEDNYSPGGKNYVIVIDAKRRCFAAGYVRPEEYEKADEIIRQQFPKLGLVESVG